MALGKTQPLDMEAITGVVGLPPVNAELISRIDRLEFDTRPGEAMLKLTASTYANQEAVAARTPIKGADEELTFLSKPQPAIDAIIDPDTGEELEPAVPAVPSLKQLLESPIRTQRGVVTFEDLQKWYMRELYLRWPELKPHWQGSQEV